MASLLIMAKAAVPGRVKTRLCPPCDSEQAAEVALACLRDTFDAARRCSAERVVVALDGEPGPWIPRSFDVVAQVGDSFNDRLANAWATMPEGGIQIGMDTPQITGALLDAALHAVARSGAAIGLASDGGWWLLGLHRPHATVFDGIAMSTTTTGAHQLARLQSLGLAPEIMATITDVDTWHDACAVAALIPGSHTAEAIAAIATQVGASE